MTLRNKNILYSVIVLVAMAAVWQYRKGKTPSFIQIEGETMATSYHISYFDLQNRNFKQSIDSLLVLVNKAINNYNPNSEVSRFNKGDSVFNVELPYLLPALEKAQKVFAASNGAFDMTIMPLVNYWGFGPDKTIKPDSSKIDSLKALVGFEKIRLTANTVAKTDNRTQLDFGGIGQGYGADVIADYLKSKGIVNALVELGGEGLAMGMNLKTQKPWEIGILDPNSTRDNMFFKAYASLSNKAFTTSGNYFNYKIVDGRKFSHTIDPESGYPVKRSLLSATVFANDCTTADAWGTAIMVMGHEKALEVLKKHPELDVLLFYTTDNGDMEYFVTEKIKSSITIKP
ncbi:FAD:protein FMN transferase [Chryseotalea sanaruensis]|nr:FAD:protein FMN transferase [Chryseotalea sanaruensis]